MGATIRATSEAKPSPWQFKLQYHTLLMQTGVIGALLVVAIAVIVVASVRKAARLRPDMNPTLTVTLCAGVAMLIANASNPHLQAPAHMWAIFLPLAVINIMLRDPAPEHIVPGTLAQPQKYLRAECRRRKSQGLG